MLSKRNSYLPIQVDDGSRRFSNIPTRSKEITFTKTLLSTYNIMGSIQL